MALFGKTPSRRPVNEIKEISVSFACQTCGVRVTKAKYIATGNVIAYECSEGHRNVIEDFGLDLM